jgi:hypothetical protein
MFLQSSYIGKRLILKEYFELRIFSGEFWFKMFFKSQFSQKVVKTFSLISFVNAHDDVIVM